MAGWVKEDAEVGKTLSSAALSQWVFSGPAADNDGVHSTQGSWSAKQGIFLRRGTLPMYGRQVFRASIKGVTMVNLLAHGKTIKETSTVHIWVDDAVDRDGVLIVSFESKMSTIGPDVIDGLTRAVDPAGADYKGLVVWQPMSLKLGAPGGPFSTGANLEGVTPAFMTDGAKGIEPFAKKFQDGMMRVKHIGVPVVSATSDIALNGSHELLLYPAKHVATLETCVGLVEVGVGLVPAGGDLKEAVLTAAKAAQTAGSTNILQLLINCSRAVAMAKVSSFTLDAQRIDYLQSTDTIVFDVYELLYVTRSGVRALSDSGYHAPLRPVDTPVAGRSDIATTKTSLANMRDGGSISQHNSTTAPCIVEAVCGGDVEASVLVNEEWLLAPERRAFVDLLGSAKAQERIMGMLQTDKPVRS